MNYSIESTESTVHSTEMLRLNSHLLRLNLADGGYLDIYRKFLLMTIIKTN